MAKDLSLFLDPLSGTHYHYPSEKLSLLELLKGNLRLIFFRSICAELQVLVSVCITQEVFVCALRVYVCVCVCVCVFVCVCVYVCRHSRALGFSTKLLVSVFSESIRTVCHLIFLTFLNHTVPLGRCTLLTPHC